MLKGVLTALATPMDGEALDLAAFEKLVAWQVECGIHGLVVAGTTGEAPTLTADERRALLAAARRPAGGRVPIVMGVGSNSTRTTLEQAAAAADGGADALLVVVPYYNKPTQDGLLRHFSAVLEAARLPVLAYNVPGRTVSDLLPATLAQLVGHPRFAGIKEATGNMERALDVGTVLREGQALLSGDDGTFLPLLACGGHGVISVASNVAPRELVSLQAAWDAGRPAEALARARKLAPLCKALFVETNPGPVKAALALLGRAPVGIRSPLAWPAAATRERLGAALGALGLLGSGGAG
ncbi:MAG: 4-hydroxy-tetrahydrodipicolinate synthase [Deltaproteobacteria bacterium]|nr:4-hydroxy-tetrahydrodipicolinate synthase [Deltaproteobacteria bacterium]